MTRWSACALVASMLAVPSWASAQWGGFVDVSADREVARYDFEGAAGSNENYYDGDFGDFDGDGRIDRAIISRYGLLWNAGEGIFVPVSSQRDATTRPNSRPSLTGYAFGDEARIGNDAVQWVDLDGDGDLDVVQGGNGEPFVVQMNRGGRFTVTQRLSASAVQIVTTDLERDGDADLLVACWFAGGPADFTVFVNDGRGELTDETAARGLDIGARQIIGLASGDVDGDGDFDVLAVSREAGQLWIFSNDGAGSFTRREVDVAGRFRVTSGFAQTLSLGDIDGDGDLDAIMATDDYVGSSSVVGHLAFVNDGSGGFAEEAGSRFVVAGGVTGRLVGANGKLLDVDYDGDLDFLAFTDLAGPPLNFQLYLNDGDGVFTWSREGVPAFGAGRPSSVGADTDVADLNGDGTYDVWVGIGGGQVTHLENTWRDPSGLPADVPRDVRVEGAEGGAITLSWSPPPFAATARHYIVYRSVAAGRERRDRERLRVVGLTAFEDEGFSAPLGGWSASALLDDAVSWRDGRVQFRDEDIEPGVRYFYSVSHVGPENAESAPSGEVSGQVSAPSGADERAPRLQIVSPTTESWASSVRLVVTHADASGIDAASLSLTLDVDAAGAPAGTNLAERALVRQGDVTIAWVSGLPVGPVELVARVADAAGNVAESRRTFAVVVEPGAAPSLSASGSPASGAAPLDVALEASASAGGEVLRWEWDFGDGATAIGRRARHRYATEGRYTATVRAIDHTGASGTATVEIEVAPCETSCGPPDAGPPGDDAAAGVDGGVGDDDRVPARGGCSASGGARPIAWSLWVLALWAWRRR